jgi:hypothetical protein
MENKKPIDCSTGFLAFCLFFTELFAEMRVVSADGQNAGKTCLMNFFGVQFVSANRKIQI